MSDEEDDSLWGLFGWMLVPALWVGVLTFTACIAGVGFKIVWGFWNLIGIV
jgi:hypothetical protein